MVRVVLPGPLCFSLQGMASSGIGNRYGPLITSGNQYLFYLSRSITLYACF
jgi:hypothetical protein